MKRCAAEWITALKRCPTAQIRRDAHVLERLASLHSDSGAARCQRQTSPVIYCSARNQARHIEHALVVLVSATTVRLKAEVRLDGIVIGGKKLNVEKDHEQRQTCNTQSVLKISLGLEKWRRGLRVHSLSTDRSENTQSAKVRKHRRTTVAQERRDDSRQGNDSEAAGDHDETGNNQKHRHCGREKETIVIARASGDTESTRRNDCVHRGDHEKPNESELLANG